DGGGDDRRRPDASLTYRHLHQQADELAEVLRSHGVGPGVFVAVALPRSLQLSVSLLAVLKAGGAYVPIDPDLPESRIRFMLSDARPCIVLTEQRLSALFAAGETRVIAVDRPWPRGQDGPIQQRPLTGDDPVYMIYTSGSTGRPKGAINTQDGFRNRLLWMRDAYAVDSRARILHKTTISFDVSGWELFLPLIVGGQLIMARPGGHRQPDYLRDLIDRLGATMMHFVPSMLSPFLDILGDAGLPSLRQIICSGEELTVQQVGRVYAALPAVELHNLYGPTEAAIDVTAWHCAPDHDEVPIGHPVANTQMHVLDGRGQPVPPGVLGSLYIGGIQVGLGYHNRAELSAERFRDDPFAAAGGRLYDTGDLAWRRHDGALMFAGRADRQIKIRGQRIEPGEIEACLRTHPQVAEAVVDVREGRLIAWITATAQPSPQARSTPGEAAEPSAALPDTRTLRAFATERLPEAMVPVALVPLDGLPLTPSGKLDRRALPAPQRVHFGAAERIAPATPSEQYLAELWARALRMTPERIGVCDDFFALGG
ncbi:MAG: amino acid adenylation domain-containing protein, partial [Myxococcota bacterium]